MVGTSKILTVSYGTFSCTLEGFDDPFSTMKSISEYFRDLAAEDRYFGAEPPTPDAEMLQRIAEREIQRRVEARIKDSALVLRQLDDDRAEAPMAAPATSAAAMAAAAQPMAKRPAPKVETPVDEMSDDDYAASESFDSEIEMDRPAAPEMTDGDSIADKLSRIRAVVSGAKPDQAFSEDEHADTAFDDDLNTMFDDEEDEAELEAPVADIAEVEEEDQPEVAIEIEDEVEAEAEAELEDAVEDEAIASDEDDAEPEAVEEDDAPVVDTVEADDDATEETLAAIGAELAGSFEDIDGFEETLEDEAENTDEDQALDSLIDTFAEGEAEEEVAEDEFEFEGEIEEETAEAEDLTADEGDEDEIDEDLAAEFDAFEDEAAEDSIFDEDLEDEDDQDEATAEADAPAVDDEPRDEVEKAANLVSRARARIIKMRRSTLEEKARIAGTLGDTSLSEEDEDDLISELAAAAAPTDSIDDDTPRENRSKLLEDHPVDESEDVGRLLAETDREFSNSEGSRRRSAIQHLKAAVLARRSDHDTTAEDEDEEAVKSRFQDDLARVVKPRRPVSGDAKKSDRRMPPLMLISEQRVDLSDNEGPVSEAAPIRPRRVTAGNLALRTDEDEVSLNDDDQDAIAEGAMSQATSFADYAAQVGAEDLTDLLEAAAAYTAYVEGQPDFSRPQIMKAVSELKADDGYTREDGLRSFGTLLRTGKIKKLERGRFMVAESTRFKPEARIAGE